MELRALVHHQVFFKLVSLLSFSFAFESLGKMGKKRRLRLTGNHIPFFVVILPGQKLTRLADDLSRIDVRDLARKGCSSEQKIIPCGYPLCFHHKLLVADANWLCAWQSHESIANEWLSSLRIQVIFSTHLTVINRWRKRRRGGNRGQWRSNALIHVAIM